MAKGLAILALVFVLTGAGFFGYRTYNDRQLIQSAIPSIKNTALRVSNALNSMTDDKSGLTYKEMFDKVNADLAEIDKRLLDIQTSTTPSTKERLDEFAKYLKLAQEVLRAESNYFRKQLATENALEWARKAADRIVESSSRYELTYTSKAADDALSDARKKLVEMESAALVMNNALSAFEAFQHTIAPHVGTDTLVESQVLDRAEKWLTEKANIKK